ncbi:HD domain-containing protein [Candidatus Uhrbacteria bacterium]|nr:HD domain-containing protein [Candidatus Uhrbacteria bacterium]
MNQDQQALIESVAQDVRARMAGDSSHDWWHILRVWNMAKHLCGVEKADTFMVELGALLHDVADWKFHEGDEAVGPRVASEILTEHHVESRVIEHISEIISTISFKGAGVATPMRTLEGQIVQDADRLDAIGAIGIARTFAYGGAKNRTMYDPDHKPTLHQTKEEYFHNNGATINHFYEKLLLLKDRMNTDAAKAIAQGRHQFMETYLQEFLNEWGGTK